MKLQDRLNLGLLASASPIAADSSSLLLVFTLPHPLWHPLSFTQGHCSTIHSSILAPLKIWYMTYLFKILSPHN